MREPAYRPLAFREYPPSEMSDRAVAFRELMARRRTVRDFADRPVPRSLIEHCVMTAGTAPSGANQQPWTFVCISDPAIKHRIRIAAEEEERTFYGGRASAEWLEALAPLGTDADKPYLEIAPWHIIAFGQRKGGIEPGDRKQNYYVTESVGIACGFLLLALHAAGLATLTHTPNPMGFLNRLCGRPAHEKPLMVIVAGRPAADATVPAHALVKKPLSEISTWL